MKEFWCVNQKYFDSGCVKVNVYAVKAESKPVNGQRENMMCDEYHDYFDTYKEAQHFAAKTKNA